MGLGEVAPGGVGSGLYGMLVLAVMTVFIAGLMVGRTPEYLRKKITAREIKLVSLYILTMPLIVLVGTGIAMSLRDPEGVDAQRRARTGCRRCCTRSRRRRTTTARRSRASRSTRRSTTSRSASRMLARPVPADRLRARAGRVAGPPAAGAETAGTLPTHGPLFVGMLAGVVIIVAGLTFFPVLALGPLAEGL